MCESIIIPNLQFREDDEELFESNHVEYIRRDIEARLFISPIPPPAPPSPTQS